jgi:hypothetical protein
MSMELWRVMQGTEAGVWERWVAWPREKVGSGRRGDGEGAIRWYWLACLMA